MSRTADVSDIRQDSWIERRAPAPIRPYLTLMRLDRPIGTWLLLLPCWWGLVLAPRADGFALPDLWWAALFAVGAVVMRGAGCVVNDIIDRDIDAQVARTRNRPLPSGRVTLRQAVLFLGALLLLGLVILLQFNTATTVLGVASLALVFPYPVMKRLTWWPQAFLGLTFNWGALMGWTAVTGTLGWPALTLYAAGLFWTLGYDTIYAHQDKEDDARIGVRSTARRLGTASRGWVAGFYVATAGLLALAGWLAGLHPIYLVGLAVATALQMRRVAAWRMDDPLDCLARFKAESGYGLIVLAGLLAGRILASGG